ncbi:hypothetical protein EPN87_02020 [archaeon]|nr:MAG: hypothetical protein EPN87_02020 [archaeon]
MAEFYLDIETARSNPKDINEKANLDPRTGKIITIQFQQLDSRTGKPIGELQVLKEWKSSEKDILNQFFERFNIEKTWDFIPVGHNLSFEFKFLRHKSLELLAKDIPAESLYVQKPFIDIKHICVILNGGNFLGCGLDNFSAKLHDGKFIDSWYQDGEYENIEKYVNTEASAFVELYQEMKSKIPIALDDFLKKVRKNKPITQ